jgi:PKD repeat protein
MHYTLTLLCRLSFYMAVLVLCLPVQRLHSQTGCTNNSGIIWVTNKNDAGAGSLREAINCANYTPGRDTIRFNIPGGGQHIIQVGAMTGEALPTLTDTAIVIDGSTQPGYGNNNNYQPRIILDGGSVAWTAPINAIYIQADSCAVFALEIRNFPDDGIDALFAAYVTIGGINKGNVIYNCGIEQDYFPDSNSGPWDGCGIVVRGGDHCIVQGNIIGTNYQQTLSGGNEYCGVLVRSSSDSIAIGGILPGQGNIIAHNKVGIRLSENSFYCPIRLNKMYCNDSIAIEFRQNSNSLKAAPVFTGVTAGGITGTSANNDRVDVYLADEAACANGVCQGKTWLGTVIVSGTSWTLSPPYANGMTVVAGNQLTAIATTVAGSSSRFATCFTVPPLCNITASAVNIMNTSCGQSNGSFTVNAAGGTTPYTYNIGNGNVSNPVFNNLSAGSYTVLVSDAQGCQISFGITILGSSPVSLTISNTLPSSCGQPNGGFTVNATGGSAPYAYNIGNGATGNPVFSGLSAGNYTVTVSDAAGCTKTANVVVAGTSPPIIGITNLMQSSCGLSNGGFTINANGGSPPYTYNIGNGNTSNPVFTNLTAGIYNITVTDASTCQSFATVTISTSVPMTVTVTNVNPATCGQSNGSFRTVVSGGNSPYTFNIGNGPVTNPIFNDLSPGVYTVTVTDANACTQFTSVTIGNTAPPAVNITNVVQATCGNANGSFTVTATGGTAPYSYNIGNGTTNNPVFNGLSAGTYNITVTDANDCNAFATMTIVNAGQPPVSGFAYIENALNVSFNAAGGGGQSYLWYFGDGSQSTQQNPVHNYANGGNYEVCLVATGNCGSDTTCETISLSLSVVSLSGHVSRENLTPVANVSVFCPACSDTTQTNTEGDYQLADIPGGTTVTITPYKNINPVNGVTSYDLFLISRHILNIEPLNSPYKIVAADANRSNTVTVTDLLEIQKLILGYTTSFPNNTSWRFIDADYVFPDPAHPFDALFPESIVKTPATNISGVNFIAVKTGDVNNNAAVNPFSGGDEDRSGEVLRLVTRKGSERAQAIVPFSIQLPENEVPAAFQFTLSFNPSQWEYVGFEQGDLSGFSQYNIGIHLIKEGLITVSWYHPGEAVSGRETGTFLLRRKTLVAEDMALMISGEITPALAWEEGSAIAMEVELSYEATLPGTDFTLLEAVPNPFSDRTVLTFYLPGESMVQLDIHDTRGQLVDSWQGLYPAGWNNEAVHLTDLTASGLYYATITTAMGTKTVVLAKQ